MLKVCNKSIVSSIVILPKGDISMTLSSLITVKNYYCFQNARSILLVKKVISFQMGHKYLT